MYDFRKICKSGRDSGTTENVEAVSSFGVRSPYRPGVTVGLQAKLCDKSSTNAAGKWASRAAFFLWSRARAALLPVSLLFLVALTGIEPAGRQSGSVQFSLSRYIFSPAQFATGAFRAVRRAGVVCRSEEHTS